MVFPGIHAEPLLLSTSPYPCYTMILGDLDRSQLSPPSNRNKMHWKGTAAPWSLIEDPGDHKCAACPPGISHVSVCTSVPGAGGVAIIEEDCWRRTQTSMLQYKRCNKRNVPSILSTNSPCSVCFLLQHLEEAVGQLWVCIHNVPIFFLGISYKFLHSLERILVKTLQSECLH